MVPLEHVKEKIECIPDRERIFLQNFFAELMQNDSLAYVLFGSKPMCTTGYFVELPMGNRLCGHDTFFIKKGWEIWKKYEVLFPHPNYIIVEEDEVRGDQNLHALYFINKKNTLQITKKNRAIFQYELHEDFDPQAFIVQMERAPLLKETLSGHEGLLGILLGYGVENSMKYHERILHETRPILFEGNSLSPINASCSHKENVCISIAPIRFVGDPDSIETQAIVKENFKEKLEIEKKLSQGNFLELFLQKLMEKEGSS